MSNGFFVVGENFQQSNEKKTHGYKREMDEWNKEEQKKNVHNFTLFWFKHDRSTIDDGNGDDENKCACIDGEPTYA